MIRLTPQKRYHVSNRLAFFAALLLAIASLAGLPERSPSERTAADGPGPVSVQAGDPADQGRAGPRKRKLNISRLLFGHG